MDPTIPAPAAYLLKFIYKTETGKNPPDCYDVIFGQRQKALSKRLTQMTLDEVQSHQKTWSTKAWGRKFNSSQVSSAAGAPQFMRATLQGLIKELKLPGSMKFDGNLQDRLAYHLLKRRGYVEYMSGRISLNAFAKRLAQEWASIPVLEDTKGAHRKIYRGETYYAGDNLNLALVKPHQVEEILTNMKDMANSDVTKPGNVDAEGLEEDKLPVTLITAIFIIVTSFFAWLAQLPCNLFNVFCGG